MNNEKTNSEIPKDLVIIYSTEDEKIKEVGKLLTFDTSRKILELLFSETLTAKQISEKTGYDLSLTKYHLNRMLFLNVIKISKIEKSIKAQNVKYYSASYFAIVILPSNASNNAKKSKMLLRSFKMIYKIMSVSIIAIATWFGTQFLHNYAITQEPIQIIIKNMNNGGNESALSMPDNITRVKNPIITFFDVSWLGIQPNIFWPLVATTIVISVGIFFILYKNKK